MRVAVVGRGKMAGEVRRICAQESIVRLAFHRCTWRFADGLLAAWKYFSRPAATQPGRTTND